MSARSAARGTPLNSDACMVRAIGFRMLLSMLRLQGPLSAWTGMDWLGAACVVERVRSRVGHGARAAAPGWGAAETKRQKRVGGFYRSAKCVRGARVDECFGRRDAARHAARHTGERAAPRGTGAGMSSNQLPAIVSTGLKAPCSTL
ncbi:hypothetical protein BVIET440_40018 [Burkholderia vietnamiensis]